MNDEIKEILHLLKRCDNTYLKIENSNGEKEYEYHKVNDLRLDGYHSQLLLDYITNLQEENEELKEQKKKTIEYIKKVSCNNNIYFYTEDTDDVLGDISKILGGDE